MTHKLTRRSVSKGIALSAGALAFPAIGRAQAQSVKIAMIAPMSGPWARQGQLLRMGADLAIEDINARGGIKSLGGAKLNIIYGDAGDSTEKAKNAAQRLVADNPDLVGGTGSWLSSFTLAVTEVTERAQIALADPQSIPTRSPIAASNSSFRRRRPPNGKPHRPCRPLSTWRKARTGKRPKTIGIDHGQYRLTNQFRQAAA